MPAAAATVAFEPARHVKPVTLEHVEQERVVLGVEGAQESSCLVRHRRIASALARAQAASFGLAESAQAASEAEEALLGVVLEQARVVQHSLATQAGKALQFVHELRRSGAQRLAVHNVKLTRAKVNQPATQVFVVDARVEAASSQTSCGFCRCDGC